MLLAGDVARDEGHPGVAVGGARTVGDGRPVGPLAEGLEPVGDKGVLALPAELVGDVGGRGDAAPGGREGGDPLQGGVGRQVGPVGQGDLAGGLGVEGVADLVDGPRVGHQQGGLQGARGVLRDDLDDAAVVLLQQLVARLEVVAEAPGVDPRRDLEIGVAVVGLGGDAGEANDLVP
ncbi:hypothetical protein D3C86_1321130 [compost metagenome]